jgi:hypothetical protein
VKGLGILQYRKKLDPSVDAWEFEVSGGEKQGIVTTIAYLTPKICKMINGSPLIISFDANGADESFNQILSTFKFTGSTADTSTWKTYTNTKYKFEFRYPTDKLLLNPSDGIDYENVVLIDKLHQGSEGSTVLNIQVIDNPKNLSLQSYYDQNIGNKLLVMHSGTNTTLNGNPAIEFSETDSVSAKHVIILDGNKILSFVHYENELADGILSTFKFTK